MALQDEEIIALNPWWLRSGWREEDPHLRGLRESGIILTSALVDKVDLEHAGVHVMRGPRQVGKSTDLKLIVDRAIGEGRSPGSIVYLALDLLEDQPLTEVARTVRRAKELAPHNAGTTLLLLDEVTVLERWQTALKALWDEGTIRDDVVICTGSSAIDLRSGVAERLPGRRGAGMDLLVLPQSFAGFARALHPSLPEPPRLGVEEMMGEEATSALAEGRLFSSELRHAFDLYLEFGGLPAAVAEAAAGVAKPSREVQRVLYDSILRETQRRGAGATASQALLERVALSLGSKTSWSSMAREMDVPLSRRGKASHHTMRDYIELLAAGYFIFVLYFWRASTGSNELSRDKKVFFGDPLLYTVIREHAPGLHFNRAAMVENVVGLSLLRHYESDDSLTEAFASPSRLHIWQTARGGEVDFVCGPRQSLDVVEVKYQRHPAKTAAAAAARAHPGRPVVMVTVDDLEVHESYSLIPAPLFLWALG